MHYDMYISQNNHNKDKKDVALEFVLVNLNYVIVGTAFVVPL